AGVGLPRGLVLVGLVEVVEVRVLLVLQHVEAQAARLVALRAERVDLDGLEELLPHLRLDPHLHPHRDHRSPPSPEVVAAPPRPTVPRSPPGLPSPCPPS